MTALRRALRAFATVFAALGLVLLLAPNWALERFGQAPYPDAAFLRVGGAMSVGLAMFAAMVERRDDAWWWGWGFAVVTGLCATIATLHAALDAPAGGEALWWVLAAVNVVLTVAIVVGLTRASQEHPIA
jgi:hypothetical protein